MSNMWNHLGSVCSYPLYNSFSQYAMKLPCLLPKQCQVSVDSGCYVKVRVV